MAAEKIDALELDITSKATTENVDKLIESLGRLSTALNKIKSKSVSVDVKNTGDASKSAAVDADKLTNSFLNQAVKITALIALYRKLASVISSAVNNSVTYIKSLNMFTVSLGEYADNATKYGETVRDALGIDISGWQKTQGIFQTLVTGFGVTGDKAAYMSQNLTQLSYDIASFYGLTNEEAANKLKSALSGRLEPIRKLGYDLSQSKLVDLAKNPANYGKQTFAVNEQTGAIEQNTIAVDKNTKHKIVNFNQLTQQEKVQLRYIALMTQVTQVQGDYARALNDPANQLKVFKEQVNMTSRAFGNMFIPALNKVLPYLSAFAQLAQEAFQSLANLFGFELPDMKDRTDISGNQKPYNDVVKATGNAAKNAKKLKDYMLGIDELNVFDPRTAAGGGGAKSGQNSNLKDLLTPGYDFLSKAVENSVKKARETIQKFFKDLKANPFLLRDIFVWGGEKLFSKFWEKVLGKTPEELEADAIKYGRSTGEQFIIALAAALSEKFGKVGSAIWTVLLGRTPEQLAQEAEANGTTVGQAFVDRIYDELTGVDLITALFGTPEQLAERAEQTGNDVVTQFQLEFARGMAKLADNDVFKWFYKFSTGRTLESDLAKINKALEPKKKSAYATAQKDYSYISQEKAKTLSEQNQTRDKIIKRSQEVKLNVTGNTSAQEAQKQGERYIKSFGKVLASGKSVAKTEAENTTKAYYENLATKTSLEKTASSAKKLGESASTGLDENGMIKSKFGYISADEAKAYYSKFSSNDIKAKTKSAVTAMANTGVSAAKSKTVIDGFKTAGENAASGYISGINKYLKDVGKAGADMGAKALEEANKKTKTASPSKAFAEIGMYSALGYAKGITDYTSNATQAVERMAAASMKAAAAYGGSSNVSIPTGTNAGYAVGASNEGAMASLASSIYQAVVSGMSNATLNTGNDRETNIIIDGKRIFKVVESEKRKRGAAISNGAFSR